MDFSERKRSDDSCYFNIEVPSSHTSKTGFGGVSAGRFEI